MRNSKKSKKHFCTEKFKYCIGDSRPVYKLLNDIKGSNNNTKIAALYNCTDSSEIAHKFNEYFTGIANELRKSLPNAPCSTELETAQHSMFLRKVSMAELLEILISFENKSSSGDDNVNMINVKKSSSVITPYLELLINCSFAQGVFPSDLKQAKVIPLHKGGSRLDENNYRPISLLKEWSKIFERAMFVRLYQYFVNFNLLYGYNRSLIKNRSDKGGGLMLKVKSNCSILTDIPVTFDEAICADIENSGYKLRTLVVYNKPRTDKMEFIDLLDHNLEELSQPSLHFVVCGDLNINVLESNLLVNRYKTCIESNGFEFNKFQKLRSTFEAELKKSKKHFCSEKFKYCIGDSRPVYKLLNDIKGSNNNTKIAALYNCTDSSEIAHKFNEYFTAIANELRKSLHNAPCRTGLETVQPSMFLRKVSMAEVLEISISFENKSSSGDGNVNMIIVKKSSSVIAPYLELLINCSFAQGVFPSDLKQAKVIPLHKGGSRLDENNYRPISLLKEWSKIFERAMFVRLYQYFVNFNLLYGYNRSLIKNRSDKGGGLMLKVKSNCSILTDIPVTFDEAICADIENSGYKLRTLVVYNKPRTDKMEFIDLLDHNLEELSQPSLHFVVCGDLNINVLESNLLVNRYKTCIESNGFEFNKFQKLRSTFEAELKKIEKAFLY